MKNNTNYQIALLHKYYTDKHLGEVIIEMDTLGAPVIRAIWSEIYGMWMAVEGCHRIRAAKILGITPIIVDIADQDTVTIQIDGDDVDVNVAEYAAELEAELYRTDFISFSE